MSDRRRVIVIHGAYGSPEENWFPYVRRALENDYAVEIPVFPTPEGQSLDSWLEVFHSQIAPLRSSDILVGHSIGAGFIIRLLERVEPDGGPHVAATLLVSSFLSLLGNDEFDPINRTIVVGECDWAKVQSRAGVVRVWHGSDDPYVPEPLGREVADKLEGDFVVLRGGGHVNAGAGYADFPELVNFIRGLTG